MSKYVEKPLIYNVTVRKPAHFRFSRFGGSNAKLKKKIWIKNQHVDRFTSFKISNGIQKLLGSSIDVRSVFSKLKASEPCGKPDLHEINFFRSGFTDFFQMLTRKRVLVICVQTPFYVYFFAILGLFFWLIMEAMRFESFSMTQ